MQTCNRCGRTLPEDEPTCPECGTQPFEAESIRRAAARAVESFDSVGTATPSPSRGAARGAQAAASAGASTRGASGERQPTPIGAASVAAVLEPKSLPFGEERTGSQRKAPSGEWARGEGAAAKILALRPEHVEDAVPAAASEAARDTPAPAPDASRSGVRPAAPSGSGEHPKALVLASESLRADMAPNAPGRGLIRVAAAALGAVGAIAVLTVAGPTPAALGIAAALALVAALGIVPLDYRQRAVGLLAVALPGALAASILAAPRGGVPHGGLLALMVSGLAGALYFRAEYRASRLARGLVAAGVGLGAIWLIASGALSRVAAMEASWQSWLPITLGAALAVVLALALLGFMTHNSTGGCAAWATMLLVWLAVYETVVHAAVLFPAAGDYLSGEWQLGVAVGPVATPIFAAIAALAVAHLLVVVSGGGRETKTA